MPALRLALAQTNMVVGDIAGNCAKIVTFAREASRGGADLLAFPEMAVTGYPVEDLALRGTFVAASRKALDALAGTLRDEGLGELVVVIGYLDATDGIVAQLGVPKGSPRNALAVLHRGEVRARSFKHHLPNYGVFDEFRHFVPGNRMAVVTVNGVDVAVWHLRGPVAGRTVRCRPGCRRRAAARHQRLTVRGEQGRHPARAVCPSGA